MPSPKRPKLHRVEKVKKALRVSPAFSFKAQKVKKRATPSKKARELGPQSLAVIEAIELRKKLSAMRPAERIGFLKAWLRDASNRRLYEQRRRSRRIISEAIRNGSIISKSFKGSIVLYNASYRRFASPTAMRLGRKLEPIVVKGQITRDGTIARNTVYKAVVKGLSMARKTYIDVPDRAQSLLNEASALIEASKRRVPVVEFVRGVISRKRNLAVLYTVMPKGYETLAHTGLGREALSYCFLEALGRAVGKMHNAGIIHYDLDPENILWNRNPYAPKFIFLDFELAAVLNRRATLHEASSDLGLLMESLQSPRFGVKPYSEAELRDFIRGYSAETGYSEDVMLGREDVFAEQEERNALREDMLRRLGFG